MQGRDESSPMGVGPHFVQGGHYITRMDDIGTEISRLGSELGLWCKAKKFKANRLFSTDCQVSDSCRIQVKVYRSPNVVCMLLWSLPDNSASNHNGSAEAA